MELPIISIVISARNEEKHIASCLMSLKAENYPRDKIEIIVMDDGSIDQTAKIARGFGAKIIKSNRDKKGIKNFRGAAVNQGVSVSGGEVVFFPDADMTFDPNLFTEIAKKVIDNDALYIPEVMIGKGLFGRVRNFERSFYNQTPVDAVRVVKKSIYLKAGGYDEKNIYFGADDWDLTKSIKQATKKISITRNKLYHHEELLDWKTFLVKKNKYAPIFDSYIQKWGKNDFDVKRQLGVVYRSLTIFTENGKWRRLVKRPDLALCMYCLRFVTWVGFKIAQSSSRSVA